MNLRALLAAEFNRRQRNRQYSLRSFARSLGIHHSTLVRLGQGKRLTPRTALRLGTRLGLSAGDIAAASAHENAEAVLALIHHPAFRPDCRWLAVMTGLSLDDVNVTLHRLVAARRLTMASPKIWREERA